MFTSLEQVEIFFQERKKFGIKPGLDRMYKLLASQNNPQERIKTIHIAGTNGKGSTLTFLKDALIHNHLKVGVFTSPSLTGILGHILINDQPIDCQQFLLSLNTLLPTIQQLDSEGMHPTEFEIITAIAYMYFAEVAVDIAIIEAGMGGREDATNCIHPILSIITNIAMDHAKFLGDTLEKIAYQKAGIIKDNTPVILGNIDSSCLDTITQEAESKNASVYQLYGNYFIEKVVSQKGYQMFAWKHEDIIHQITIQMHGFHQIENVAVAIMALQLVESHGFPLDWGKIKSALQTSQIAGRFEKINKHPVIIVDGAHNPNGIDAFLKTVMEEYGDKRKHLIFAGFRDKELTKMLRHAIPYFDSVTITSFDSPRAKEADILAKELAVDKISVNSDWQNIVDGILNQDYDASDYYFFAGSLHFIGLVRSFIKEKQV